MVNWKSYDSLAAAYELYAVPHFFVKPADDLISILQLELAHRVLDVGTGTGVVAAAVASHMGSGATVVGVDLSPVMLGVAASKCAATFVVAKLPVLPFFAETYDVAIASFVITHIPSYSAGFREILRVLVPGGKIGITTWATTHAETEAGRLWQDIADKYVQRELVNNAVENVIRWESLFSKASQLMSAMKESGFNQINIAERRYLVGMSVEEYVSWRETVMSSRYMKEYLSGKDWSRLLDEARRKLSDRFPNGVSFWNGVNFAVGVKP